MLVLGLALCGSMAWLIHYLQQALAQATPTRWKGGPEFTRTTFSLFYSIFAFGVVAFASGVFQIGTGRRSRAIPLLTLGALGPIVYFVYRILSMKPPG